MSYCRWGDCDVYVYMHIHKYLVCCGCRLNKNGRDARFHKYSDMLNHLKEHEKIGDFVPAYAILRLKEEQKDLGDIIYARQDNEN